MPETIAWSLTKTLTSRSGSEYSDSGNVGWMSEGMVNECPCFHAACAESFGEVFADAAGFKGRGS